MRDNLSTGAALSTHLSATGSDPTGARLAAIEGMPKPVRRLLVPLDGSPPSIAALDQAVALAEDSTATVDVLHVEAPDDFEVGSATPSAPIAQDAAQREMDAAIERARARIGGRVSRRVERGDPLREIVGVAAEGGYDLIVMGTNGRIGRLHSLIGSVAEAVVRSAPCPVLTVRAPSGEYQSFAERLHHRPSLAEQVSQAHPHRR